MRQASKAEAELREKTLALPDGAALSAQRQQLISNMQLKQLSVQQAVQAAVGKDWTHDQVLMLAVRFHNFMLGGDADQGNR